MHALILVVHEEDSDGVGGGVEVLGRAVAGGGGAVAALEGEEGLFVVVLEGGEGEGCCKRSWEDEERDREFHGRWVDGW